MAEKQTETTFETAVERLEAIVAAMESGELPLEELLERYEEGTRLVKLCGEKLAAAEKRIEIVTRNAEKQTAPFDPNTAVPPPAHPRSAKGTSKPKPSDDVSLF
ncbi:MAG: exodeoxyribonuclease VII small subunit [Chthoniobacteraceae bacterium]|nr:exodeoxyribonuclease VII small subunit [Chthoniobacteraceae bacterium]